MSDVEEVIRRIVREEIAIALRERGRDRLESHVDQPEPRRVTCGACIAGEVEGAVRSGRRWVATREAWAAWRARRSAPKPVFDVVAAAIEKAGRAGARARSRG